MAHAQQMNETTGWVGWVYFAGIMMMLAGVFQAIAGLAALFKNTVYVTAENNLVAFDFTGWGWVHLIIGIVLFFSAFSVLKGGTWGRMLGSFLAGISAIAHFAFIAAFPLWSLAIIIVDILIIYALVVHGNEARPMAGDME